MKEEKCTCEQNKECEKPDKTKKQEIEKSSKTKNQKCENKECEKHKKNEQEEKIKELENKIKEMEDKALRDKAESINYRKRKDEETSRILKFCNEDMITEMLPIIDNFESAIKMDDNNLEDEVSKFLAGFKMIYGNLVTVLEHFEVKAIDGVNKPFDPTFHQAVLTEKVENVEPGTVLDVLRKGYILKDKVIRPAMVKVSE